MDPKIIVSVLDSPSALENAAFVRGVSMARWYGSELRAVYVHPSSRATGEEVQSLRTSLVASIEPAMSSLGVSSVRVVPTVLCGSAAHEAAAYTSRIAADLVVVEEKDRRSSGCWPAGSLAATLGKAVQPPTIAVPSACTVQASGQTPFRSVVCAVDFSQVSLRALSEALTLAQESGGRLTVLHVLDGLDAFPSETACSGARAFRMMEELRARAGRVNRELRSLIPADAFNWCDIEVTTASGKAQDAIVAAANDRRADLIVMGLPRRRRLEELIAGSTAQKVLRRAAAPVLLVPGPSSVRLFGPADDHDVDFATHLSGVAWRTPFDSGRTIEERTSWQ